MPAWRLQDPSPPLLLQTVLLPDFLFPLELTHLINLP